MDTTLYRVKPLQNTKELAEFLKLLTREDVRSYLEIGSMYGGSLWRVAMNLGPGAKLVSVDNMADTPEAEFSLEACIRDLKSLGYEADLIIGDSMQTETAERVRRHGPFDCVFIDGAHTLEAVTNDWNRYGHMGRMVAFHDIAWNNTWRSKVPGRAPKAMGVPELWDKLKTRYRYQEIKLHAPSNYYGIGVLWLRD